MCYGYKSFVICVINIFPQSVPYLVILLMSLEEYTFSIFMEFN